MSAEATTLHPEIRRADVYAVAVEADRAFQAELERQFGLLRAGDFRYRTNTHDAATAAARVAFQNAAADLARRPA